MADGPFDSMSLDATFFCGSSAAALWCQVTGCPVWADFCFKLRAVWGSNTSQRRSNLSFPFNLQTVSDILKCQRATVTSGVKLLDFPLWLLLFYPLFSAWRWRMWPDSKGRNIAFTPNSRAPRIWWNGSASGKINTGTKWWNREKFDLYHQNIISDV